MDQFYAGGADGQKVVFASFGKFAGDSSLALRGVYLARRNPASGWSTEALDVPSNVATTAETDDFSASLESTLAYGRPTPNGGLSESILYPGAMFFLHNNNTVNALGDWEVAGGIGIERINGEYEFSHEVAASTDLCHIVVEKSQSPLKTFPNEGEAEGTLRQEYELVTGCNGEPSAFRLIALDNKGAPIEPACMFLGAENSSQADVYHSISNDGNEIFFVTKVLGGGECSTSTQQLFVRLGGTRTLEISRPLGHCVGERDGVAGEVPCQGAATRSPATFAGASEDGSTVYFTTDQPLIEGQDSGNGNDIYAATIGCPEGGSGCASADKEVTDLKLVSKHEGGESAEVQGIVRTAPDGARIYFVATGQLLSPSTLAQLEGEGKSVPRRGADNLYVYDRESDALTFVADLCSGPGESGGAEDAHCPTGLTREENGRNDKQLWSSRGPEAQSTDDGRVLVFATFAQLETEGSDADTDQAKDVYRFDAQSDTLARVSLGEEGASDNGNEEPTEVVRGIGNTDATISRADMGGELAALDYTQRQLDTRAISEDGSRIVFSSPEPLSTHATNGLTNVYEWHDGLVSLISGGSATQPVRQIAITPSGEDVFFVDEEQLTSEDTDGAFDVYDDRIPHVPGELVGFSSDSASPEPCEGDACQGPLTNPTALLVPGSAVQAAGENFPPPPKSSTPPAKKHHKKPKKKKKRGKGASFSRARRTEVRR